MFVCVFVIFFVLVQIQPPDHSDAVDVLILLKQCALHVCNEVP